MLHGGGVVIEYGEGTRRAAVVVRNQELFEPIPSSQLRAGSDRSTSAFTGEDEITSALIRLREGKNVKVAFTTGHGEPRPDDPGGKGLGNWKARLMRVGCEVIDLNLVRGGDPRRPGPADRGGPDGSVQAGRGGQAQGVRGSRRADPALLGNASPPGLEEFLKSYNLEIGRGLVLDPD